MLLNEFLSWVKTGKALGTDEIHALMGEMSEEARRVTFRLNSSYHTPEEVRELLSELFGYKVPESLDHGGVTIGDGCQIGHNVVFATLNHGLQPEERGITYPAPIVLGKNVWVGSNSTILQGVTIGDNAVIAAGAVVTKDVEAGTIVGGVPARFIKKI